MNVIHFALFSGLIALATAGTTQSWVNTYTDTNCSGFRYTYHIDTTQACGRIGGKGFANLGSIEGIGYCKFSTYQSHDCTGLPARFAVPLDDCINVDFNSWLMDCAGI